jgi:hypothetical protein
MLLRAGRLREETEIRDVRKTNDRSPREIWLPHSSWSKYGLGFAAVHASSVTQPTATLLTVVSEHFSISMTFINVFDLVPAVASSI